MSARPDPLAVLRELAKRFTDTMPTPLGKHGESSMHPVHHADLAFDATKAVEDVAALVEAARQVSRSKFESPGALIDSLGALDTALAPFGDKT